MDSGALHAAEFRRCLIALDVPGILRLWQHVSPHLPQPANEAEALHTLHLARTKMTTLPQRLRDYSQAWLDERERQIVACAVGVGVVAPPSRRSRAVDIHGAMNEEVIKASRAGIDLDKEAAEVKARMMAARGKIVDRMSVSLLSVR